MAYLSSSFGLLLVLNSRAGLVAGLALLFLAVLIVSSWLQGLLSPSLYRQLTLATASRWLKAQGQSFSGFISSAGLQAIVDLSLVGCLSLLIATAAVSGTPTTGCTIFFVGAMYAALFLVLFSLFGNDFQIINTSVYTYAIAAAAMFSVFVLVELLAVDSSSAFSYRAMGALWISISCIPLFFQPLELGTKSSNKRAVDIGLFPEAPLSSMGHNRHVRKARLILADPWVLWLVSLAPVFVFALYSANKSAGTTASDSGVYVLLTVIVVEALFQLTGNSINAHLLLVVFNRFVLVLVGSKNWLIGVVWAALCTSWFLLSAWIDISLPSAESVHVGELVHKSMEMLGRGAEAAGDQPVPRPAAILTTPVVVVVAAAATTTTTTTTTTTSEDQEEQVPVYSDILRELFQAYPAISLLILQVYVAIALGVASASPARLPLGSLDDMDQLSWAGCFWLIWAAASVNFLVYRVVKRNGLGRGMLHAMAQALESRGQAVSQSEEGAGSEQQPPPQANSLFLAALSSVADAIKEGMDDKPAVASLVLLAWSTTVGATVLAAYITNTWIVVPLIALLPASILVFINFLAEWEENGCPVWDFRCSSPVCCAPSSSSAPSTAMTTEPTVVDCRTRLCAFSTETASVAASILIPKQPWLKSWQLSAALLVLAIGLACIPRGTSMIAVYLGLWLVSFSANALTVVLWRATVAVEPRLVTLLFFSWIPTIIWSIVFGVRSGSTLASVLVVMLLFAATATQLLVLSWVLWKDCIGNGVGGAEAGAGDPMPDSSSARCTCGSIKPRLFLKILLSAAFVLLFVLFSVFSASISTPLGLALLMLLLASAFMTALKLGAISQDEGSIVRMAMDRLFLKCTYANTHTKAVAAVTVACLIASGVIGGISRPSHAFWWGSFSWLALAFAALVFGLYDLATSAPKSYSLLFFPVYTFDVANNLVQNVSLQSSCILLFLVMMSLYSIFCSIVVEPFEAGLVMFLVINVVLALYCRCCCCSAVDATRASVQHGYAVLDEELLVEAKREAFARIFSAEMDASSAAVVVVAAAAAGGGGGGGGGSAASKASLEQATRDLEQQLATKIQERAEAENALNQLLATRAGWSSELSPVPFTSLFMSIARNMRQIVARCAPVQSPGDAVQLQANPSAAAPAVIALPHDVESPPTPEQQQQQNCTLDELLLQLQTLHDALLARVTDLNQWRGFYRLKARLKAQETAQRKVSELLQFLRSRLLAPGGTPRSPGDEVQSGLSADQRTALKNLTADRVLELFPPQALVPLLDDFKHFRLAEEEKRRVAEQERIRREQEEATAKAELVRIALLERRKAQELAEAEAARRKAQLQHDEEIAEEAARKARAEAEKATSEARELLRQANESRKLIFEANRELLKRLEQEKRNRAVAEAGVDDERRRREQSEAAADAERARLERALREAEAEATTAEEMRVEAAKAAALAEEALKLAERKRKEQEEHLSGLKKQLDREEQARRAADEARKRLAADDQRGRAAAEAEAEAARRRIQELNDQLTAEKKATQAIELARQKALDDERRKRDAAEQARLISERKAQAEEERRLEQERLLAAALQQAERDKRAREEAEEKEREKVRRAKAEEEERRRQKERRESEEAAAQRLRLEEERRERERVEAAKKKREREEKERREREAAEAAEIARRQAAEEATRRAAELKKKQEEEERKLLELQRRKQREDEEAAAARKKKKVSMEVVGRYGVSKGLSILQVVKSLGLSKEAPIRFDDADFDLGSSSSLRDALGPGKLSEKQASQSLSTMRLTDTYRSQIQAGVRDRNYQHGLVSGVDVTQINQGQIGDCYFMSAIAALVQKPARVKKLFPLLADAPSDGSIDKKDWNELKEICSASGCFAVRLFFDGEFRIVLLDDRIVASNRGKSPYFARSDVPGHECDSIWVMLVEKAYAKLHGTFAAIEGGHEDLACEDLTGGIPSKLTDLQTDSAAKWEQLKLLHEGGHLLGAGSSSEKDDQHTNDEGIVYGHAYTILQVREVDNFKLLQLKNPWGSGEWSGEWSDKSKRWTPRYISMLGFDKFGVHDDGIFWMSWGDFTRLFRQVYICRVFPIEGDGAAGSGNAATAEDAVRFQLRTCPRVGVLADKAYCSWKKASGSDCGSAGGCANYDTFHRNPQFILVCGEDCTVTVVLSQSESLQDKRQSLEDIINARNGHFDESIGLTVFDNKGCLVTGRGRGLTVLAKTDSYTNDRNRTLEFRVQANKPLTLVPSMFAPNEEGRFSLRAYAQMLRPTSTASAAMRFELLPQSEFHP